MHSEQGESLETRYTKPRFDMLLAAEYEHFRWSDIFLPVAPFLKQLALEESKVSLRLWLHLK